MWRDRYDVQWAAEDDTLFIFTVNEEKFFAWQPICAPEKFQAAIAKILQLGENSGRDFKFFALEKFFVDELKKFPDAQFEITSDRDVADYAYLADDLINLSGRKFHGKKNHVRQFWKDYPTAEYLPITAEIIPQCREFLNQWCEVYRVENPDDINVNYEQAAIHEIFDDFDAFKLKGGAILLGGKIAAFTFGEQFNSDTAVIHVEKADPEIRGAYTAINQAFVANEWANVTYINREEDLGLEGLRRAKESYHPVKMIEKFDARIK